MAISSPRPCSTCSTLMLLRHRFRVALNAQDALDGFGRNSSSDTHLDGGVSNDHRSNTARSLEFDYISLTDGLGVTTLSSADDVPARPCAFSRSTVRKAFGVVLIVCPTYHEKTWGFLPSDSRFGAIDGSQAGNLRWNSSKSSTYSAKSSSLHQRYTCIVPTATSSSPWSSIRREQSVGDVEVCCANSGRRSRSN